jgi:hypothetical protein
MFSSNLSFSSYAQWTDSPLSYPIKTLRACYSDNISKEKQNEMYTEHVSQFCLQYNVFRYKWSNS